MRWFDSSYQIQAQPNGRAFPISDDSQTDRILITIKAQQVISAFSFHYCMLGTFHLSQPLSSTNVLC
jgi:hypothetical protein